MARRGDGIYLRGRTWWLDFVHQGERHVVRLGKGISRTVAGELARVQRGEALKSEAGIGRKRKDITFDAARDEFKKWAEANKRPRTVRTYVQCLDALAKTFAGKRLGAISAFDVERHKRTRLEAGVRVMVNRELAALRALYNRCRDWGKYEGDNPVVKVRQVKESAGRLRYLEAEEIDALVAAAGEPLRTLILVGLYTGIRIHSEALTLRWADVDLRRGLLTVQSAYAKSGKTRTVPLNRAALAALRALRERSGDREHVFARRDGSSLPLDPNGVPDGVQARTARRRDTARPATHLRQSARDDGRAPAHDPGAGRLERARDGGAVRAPERRPQRRGRRADCHEFPNAIHNTRRTAYHRPS